LSSSLRPAASRAGGYDGKRIQMSVADLQELEEIKGLVTRGQQLGVLTYAEISGAVSELDLDEADVEELHGFLERAEIELVEELDPALAAADVERATDASAAELAAAAASLDRCAAATVATLNALLVA